MKLIIPAVDKKVIARELVDGEVGTKDRFKIETETHRIEPIKYEEK